MTTCKHWTSHLIGDLLWKPELIILRLPKPSTPGYHYHCIFMPKNHHYNQNGKFKGHAAYQIKHLKQLGYNVSVVPVRKK